MQDFNARAFDPQPEPPAQLGLTTVNTQGLLIGLLLPAVQKVR
jgi:hypothetical protein